MNCEQFWKSMPGGEDSALHLHECEACAARLRMESHLTAGLRAMAAGMARLEAPSRVEARLLNAFRAQTGRPEIVRRQWIPALTWAAALAAMIAVGMFVVRDRAQQPKRPATRHIELAMSEAGANGLEQVLEEGFLLLPGAAQLAPADDMNVLHVELPRSAMMQVGFEVNPERADETVRADVMVGSDGLARAVRFVDVTGSD